MVLEVTVVLWAVVLSGRFEAPEAIEVDVPAVVGDDKF